MTLNTMKTLNLFQEHKCADLPKKARNLLKWQDSQGLDRADNTTDAWRNLKLLTQSLYLWHFTKEQKGPIVTVGISL